MASIGLSHRVRLDRSNSVLRGIITDRLSIQNSVTRRARASVDAIITLATIITSKSWCTITVACPWREQLSEATLFSCEPSYLHLRWSVRGWGLSREMHVVDEVSHLRSRRKAMKSRSRGRENWWM